MKRKITDSLQMHSTISHLKYNHTSFRTLKNTSFYSSILFWTKCAQKRYLVFTILTYQMATNENISFISLISFKTYNTVCLAELVSKRYNMKQKNIISRNKSAWICLFSSTLHFFKGTIVKIMAHNNQYVCMLVEGRGMECTFMFGAKTIISGVHPGQSRPWQKEKHWALESEKPSSNLTSMTY